MACSQATKRELCSLVATLGVVEASLILIKRMTAPSNSMIACYLLNLVSVMEPAHFIKTMTSCGPF